MQDRAPAARNHPLDFPRGEGWHVPGHIMKRNGRYILRVYAGREGGKKRDKWLTFGSRREAEIAQRKLASHTLAHSAGTGIYGSPRERLGPYLSDWLERQKERLSPTTYERYSCFVGQVRRDVLGTFLLARLTPRLLEGYYGRRIDAGSSPTTVHHHHAMIHKALRDAARQDVILQNPAALATPPHRTKTRPEVWTEAQTLLFLSEAKGSRYYPVYLLIAATGMRVGEVLGLRWKDVDLREGVLHVARSLQRHSGGGYKLKEPKTPHSCRAVALPLQAVEELRALRGQQGPHDFVFQSRGQPLHANNIRQRDVRKICERIGLSWHRALHNFRHGHASYLLQRGVSVKVVQERLGHSNPSFTLGTYAHVLAGMQEQAARATAAMLGART